ncbi:MAG: NADH-quinone oxidoreductase chain [Candidatus Midichloriaceae bacterium]|jgi:NADH-quinone oxidoreductase subunit J|nr:NADH-quinone oxidoreductase chain [Candidatus Midichloriaceae bacterium]
MVDILFYSFSALLVIAALMVVLLRNPVHSVLFLIFAFFNAAALFILLGAEFIAMTLVIVYVGAVAVLFLFVVMMININIAELKRGFLKHAPIGIILGAIIFLQIYIALSNSAMFLPKVGDALNAANLTNTEQIGMVLYTDYFIVFQLSGLILLVAMIGAIVLTLTHSKDSKRQDITKQVMQRPEDSVELVEVKVGQGVKI